MQGPDQGLRRRLDRASDHALELAPGQLDLKMRGRQVGHVEAVERSTGGIVDEVEDRFVEIHAAESFDSFRPAEDFHGIRTTAQNGRVEGAATEVVHRYDLPVVQSPGGGV